MVVVTNGEDTLSIVDFLLWELVGGRAAYECNPVNPQLTWEELSDEDKIRSMQNDLEHDLSDGGWRIVIQK